MMVEVESIDDVDIEAFNGTMQSKSTQRSGSFKSTMKGVSQ